MLSSMPMKHVRLLVLTENLPQASLALADVESFHPDTRPPPGFQCLLPFWFCCRVACVRFCL